MSSLLARRVSRSLRVNNGNGVHTYIDEGTPSFLGKLQNSKNFPIHLIESYIYDELMSLFELSSANQKFKVESYQHWVFCESQCPIDVGSASQKEKTFAEVWHTPGMWTQPRYHAGWISFHYFFDECFPLKLPYKITDWRIYKGWKKNKRDPEEKINKARGVYLAMDISFPHRKALWKNCFFQTESLVKYSGRFLHLPPKSLSTSWTINILFSDSPQSWLLFSREEGAR